MKVLCDTKNYKIIENILLANHIFVESDSKIVIVEEGYDNLQLFDVKISFCEDRIEEFQKTIQLFQGNKSPSNIVIGISNGAYMPIRINDICYFNAINNDVFAHIENGKQYIVKSKLYQLEKDIGRGLFFRINKSELINMQKISLITPMFKGKLIISLIGVEIPLDISRGYTKAFKERLGL
jgi:DNA-binding LytR/AlgR family response regulator